MIRTAGFIILTTMSISTANAESCDNLWVQRNTIYKDAGYCFTTPRAIKEFGNAGCRFDDINDVPLSNTNRSQVDEIARSERMLGCQVAGDNSPTSTVGVSRCRVMDPSSTPLNVRTRPYGNIVGTIPNGTLVSIVDSEGDRTGRPWVNVVRYESRQPVGWVYREFLACF